MFGGGKGMRGGGVLRVVSRSVGRTGVSSSSSCTSPSANSRPSHKFNNNNNINLSSSSSSCGSLPCPACGVPLSPAGNFGGPTNTSTWPCLGGADGYEWVSVNGSDGEIETPLVERPLVGDFVLGPAPSIDEAYNAVSALSEALDEYNDAENHISSPNHLLRDVSDVGPELDWKEPSPYPRTVQPYGHDRVYDAFHLLKTDPFVRKIVLSLSTDKAVWDAFLNNEVVRDLQETYHADESTNVIPESPDENGSDSNPAVAFAKWIFRNTKARVMEVFEKVTNLMNELFKPPPSDEKGTAGAADPFEDKLRTSFMLSVVVLLIVVVSRAWKA